MFLGGRMPWSEMPNSLHNFTGHIISMLLSIGDVDLDHLVKLAFASCLHNTVTIFPFSYTSLEASR